MLNLSRNHEHGRRGFDFLCPKISRTNYVFSEEWESRNELEVRMGKTALSGFLHMQLGITVAASALSTDCRRGMLAGASIQETARREAVRICSLEKFNNQE